MLTTIEDLILHIYDPINAYDRKALPARDRSILFSMAAQLRKPLAFTEKQALLAIKILTENKHLYEKIENFNLLLENPVYKYTFRAIDCTRKIFVLNETHIAVKFPFDNTFNKLLDKIPSRKTYDLTEKAHTYKLNENNIESIMKLFKDHNFEVDSKIQQWYNEIVEIRSTPTVCVPSIKVADTVELVNCNSYADEYFNKNKKGSLAEDLFLAKSMNLFFDINVHDKIQSLNISDIAKRYLSNSNHAVSVEKIPKHDLCKIFQELNTYPLLVLIDENETDLVEWVDSLRKHEVESSNMSVLFRSDKNVTFNEYIKEQKLNNFVDDNTKVVFVKNKMPKILYRMNFTPKLVVSSSSFYVHYTSQLLVDSHPAVMYYTNKQNIGKKVAQL